MRRASLFAAALLIAGCAASGAQRATLAVTLTGLQEVPGPGDPDGTGTAEVRVNAEGRLCWDLYVRQIGPATAAHVHRGPAGVSGPPVVTLTTPGADGHSRGCLQVDPALAREIGAQAHAFYLNVHTADFPDGAVRGQLRGATLRARRLGR